MASFKKQIQNKLGSTLTKEELEMLPASFQRLGHVIILRLKKELLAHKEIIGEAAITCVQGTKTACVNIGKIDSEFRQPKIEFAAGEDFFEVDHKEHECIFRFDVRKLMWSMGNMNERKRMYEMVAPNEIVVDFFAGMGYWSIPIAKHSKAKHVYAIDANPDAIASLRVNKKLNKIPDAKLTIIHGKCEEDAPSLGRIADRIIMAYLPAPVFALTAAFHTLHPRGGMIHYEGVCEEGKYEELLHDVRAQGEPLGWNVELVHVQQVKSVAPRKWHYVLDIRATPITIDEGVLEKMKKKPMTIGALPL